MKKVFLWAAFSLAVLAQAQRVEPQSNIYVNQGGRTRIVNAVDSIGFTPDQMTVWRAGDTTMLNVAGTDRITLSEYDTWRTQVMPETYWADFDYDIAFDNASPKTPSERPKADSKGICFLTTGCTFSKSEHKLPSWLPSCTK